MSKQFNKRYGGRYQRRRGNGSRNNLHRIEEETPRSMQEPQKDEVFGKKCLCGSRGQHNCVFGPKIESIERKLAKIRQNEYGLSFMGFGLDATGGVSEPREQSIITSSANNDTAVSCSAEVEHITAQNAGARMDRKYEQGPKMVTSPVYTPYSPLPSNPLIPSQSVISTLNDVDDDVTSPFYDATSPFHGMMPKGLEISKSSTFKPVNVNKINVNNSNTNGVKTLVSNNPEVAENSNDTEGVKTLVSNDPESVESTTTDLNEVEDNATFVDIGLNVVVDNATIVNFKPNLINRVLLYSSSSFNFGKLNNHFSSGLLGLKDSLRLFSDKDVLPDLYKYLLLHKDIKYSSRNQALEHMQKYALKYLNENKIDYSTQSNVFINRYLLTIQKVTDETDSELLLGRQNPNEQKRSLLPTLLGVGGLVGAAYLTTRMSLTTNLKLLPLGLLSLAYAYHSHKSNLNF